MQGSNAKSFVGSSGGNAGRELDLEELDPEELVDLKDLDLVDLKDLDVDDLEKLDQGWRWHGLQSNLEPLFASLFPDPPLVSKFASCKVFFRFSFFPDPSLVGKFFFLLFFLFLFVPQSTPGEQV